MKKILIASLALILSYTAFSQESGTGIGAKVGTNFDFTAKFWTSERDAFVASAGLDFGSNGGFHASADYLIHAWSFDVAQDKMKVYFGPGIGMGVYLGSLYYSSNFWLTARAPGGVGYYFHNIPLECFVEYVPGVDVIGPWGFSYRWESYVGARWYF